MNRRKTTKSTSSKFKGVCFYKRNRKWQANILAEAKKIHLGYFETEIEAAKAYDAAALARWGKYAAVNFPKRKQSAAHYRPPTETAEPPIAPAPPGPELGTWAGLPICDGCPTLGYVCHLTCEKYQKAKAEECKNDDL